MYEAILFLPDGFEEIEAIATLDILRRGGVNVVSVSLTGEKIVMGSRKIPVVADMVFDAMEYTSCAMLILPGGPGTPNYKKHERLIEVLKIHNSQGGRIAAICAAPTVLGELGFLSDKTAVCYPGMEAQLKAEKIGQSVTVTDGSITTSKSAGTTFSFALELLRILKGDQEVANVAESNLFS